MVQAAINGSIEQTSFTVDPIFGLFCPERLANVPDRVLLPWNAWDDKNAYDVKVRELAERFVQNAAKFSDLNPEILQAGPHYFEK